ncbi:hypothetical protein KFL_009260030 [Klebsormidium nitens]|uniref:SWIM-type domain-containing protein n=1 Tax=Klebsormidium nitens TaxID=105231 RepID=A0A1Y1IMY1_KLENI|nr:hypothetical protein KFL_009260030 [Klebsormidium nitens]|eukprot:GAQ92124.1 hypothetical protein KFL_009260030 [Klebsormidium nitens]
MEPQLSFQNHLLKDHSGEFVVSTAFLSHDQSTLGGSGACTVAALYAAEALHHLKEKTGLLPSNEHYTQLWQLSIRKWELVRKKSFSPTTTYGQEFPSGYLPVKTAIEATGLPIKELSSQTALGADLGSTSVDLKDWGLTNSFPELFFEAMNSSADELSTGGFRQFNVTSLEELYSGLVVEFSEVAYDATVLPSATLKAPSTVGFSRSPILLDQAALSTPPRGKLTESAANQFNSMSTPLRSTASPLLKTPISGRTQELGGAAAAVSPSIKSPARASPRQAGRERSRLFSEWATVRGPGRASNLSPSKPSRQQPITTKNSFDILMNLEVGDFGTETDSAAVPPPLPEFVYVQNISRGGMIYELPVLSSETLSEFVDRVGARGRPQKKAAKIAARDGSAPAAGLQTTISKESQMKKAPVNTETEKGDGRKLEAPVQVLSFETEVAFEAWKVEEETIGGIDLLLRRDDPSKLVDTEDASFKGEDPSTWVAKAGARIQSNSSLREAGVVTVRVFGSHLPSCGAAHSYRGLDKAGAVTVLDNQSGHAEVASKAALSVLAAAAAANDSTAARPQTGMTTEKLYTVVLRGGFCDCEDPSGLLCKHIRAVARKLGGLEKWNLTLDSLREEVLMEVKTAEMEQQNVDLENNVETEAGGVDSDMEDGFEMNRTENDEVKALSKEVHGVLDKICAVEPWNNAKGLLKEVLIRVTADLKQEERRLKPKSFTRSKKKKGAKRKRNAATRTWWKPPA